MESSKSTSPAFTIAPYRFVILIASLWLGSLLVAIDSMILSVAIPAITSTFDSLNDVGWYGSAYLLVLTALQPTMGKIYKYFDAKSCFLLSIFVFEVGSALCAAAPSSAILILGRAVAGGGAAGVFQGVLCIVCLIVPLEKRPLYLSIIFSVFGLATLIGPPVGGAFTTNVTWRWCFWINLPLGAVTFVLIWALLRVDLNQSQSLSLKQKLHNLDVLGSGILIASVSLLIVVLQYGGIFWPWGSSQVIGMLVGVGLLLVTFIWDQWRSGDRAAIPFRLLRQRTIFMTSCYTFLIHGCVYIAGYFLPFYFQAVQGTSATISGVRYMALAALQTFSTIIVGVLVTRSGHYAPFILAGSILGAVGAGLLCLLGTSTTSAQWAVYLVVAGLGTGIGLQLAPIAVQAVSEEQDISTNNAIVLFFGQLGGTLAVPIAEAIFVNTISGYAISELPSLSPQTIINAGATGLSSISHDAAILQQLQQAYSDGVRNTLYLAVALISVSVFPACAVEWKGLKSLTASTDPEVAKEGLVASKSKSYLDDSGTQDRIELSGPSDGVESSAGEKSETP